MEYPVFQDGDVARQFAREFRKVYFVERYEQWDALSIALNRAQHHVFCERVRAESAE